MEPYKTHPYYTHQPFFIEIIKFTNGNILECGCGDGSTIMIKEQIKNTSRKLISLESNLDWLNKYKHLANPFHELYHVEAGSDDTLENGNKWVDFIKDNKLNDYEIVFLDSSPWLSRKCCFDYYLNKAKIIIIHDFDYFPINNNWGLITDTALSVFGELLIPEYDCRIDPITPNGYLLTKDFGYLT